MGIKTSNVKVNLRVNTEKDNSSSGKTPPSAGNWLRDLIEKSKESLGESESPGAAETAFSDEETSQKYLTLQARGLNALRSEIIAVCEYIPLTNNTPIENAMMTDSNETSSNNVVTNSVARIIELHRQIREYTLTASDLVLKRLYPDLHTANFLEWLNNCVEYEIKNNEGLIVVDMSKSISNIFLAIASTNFDAGAGDNIMNFKDIVQRNSSDKIFMSVIQYNIYRSMLDSVSDYLNELSKLNLKFARLWGLTNFKKLKEFSPAAAFESGDNRIVRVFENNLTLLSNEDFSKKLLGYQTKTDTSNTDEFLSAIGMLTNLCFLKDSVTTLQTLSSLSEEELKVPANKVRLSFNSDLENSMRAIKQISLSGMIANFGAPGSLEQVRAVAFKPIGTETVYNYDDSNMITGPLLFDWPHKIKDVNGEKSGFSDGVKEAMAAMSYDIMTWYVSHIGLAESSELSIQGSIRRVLNTYGKDTTLYSLPGEEGSDSRKPENTLYRDYFNRVLGVPKNLLVVPEVNNGSAEGVVVSRSREIPYADEFTNTTSAQDAASNNSFTGGSFVRNTVGVRKDETNQSLYLPLETNKDQARKTSASGKEVLPGVAYFIQNSLSRGESSLDTTDLKKFANQYSLNAIKLFEDISTLFPDNQIINNSVGLTNHPNKLQPLNKISAVDVMYSLFNGLEKDLAAVLDNGDDKNESLLPALAIFLNNGDKATALNFFLSGFWDYTRLNGPTNLRDNRSTTEEISNTGETDLYGKTIGGLVEFYTEKSVIRFFESLGLTPRESGSDATATFYNTNAKYSTWLGDKTVAIGNLYSKDEVKDKFNGGKDRNSESPSPTDGPHLYQRMTAVKIDDVFDNCLGGGQYTEKVRNGETGKRIGLNRLLSNVFDCATKGFQTSNLSNNSLEKGPNYEYEGSLYTDTVRSLDRGTYSILNKKGLLNDYPGFSGQTEGPGQFGDVIGLSYHHRIIIAYNWTRSLLRKTLGFKVWTNADGELTLTTYQDQIKGVIDGVRTARGASRNYGSLNSDSYKESYSIAKAWCDDTVDKIKFRERSIRDVLGLFSAHSNSIVESDKFVKNVVAGADIDGNVTDQTLPLAIATLKRMNVLSDVMTLFSDQYQVHLDKEKIKFFTTIPGKLNFNSEKLYLKKAMFVNKILSSKGYGFLGNENFGNKSIINLGIPNSMISSLQRMAYNETGKIDYLTSPYVCISIFKKDHLNPEYNFYPKLFVFDTSVDISDINIDNPSGLSKHLERLTADASISKIIKNIELTRYSRSPDGGIIKDNFQSQAAAIIGNRKVLINHIHDYALKEYIRMTSGFNFEESTFLMKDMLLDNIVTSPAIGGNFLEEEYSRVLSQIRLIYPKTQLDKDLNSEVFRLIKTIRQSVPFSYENRFKQILTPNCFDKVYTMMVNEKDFVLDLGADGTTSAIIDGDGFSYRRTYSEMLNISGKLSKPRKRRQDVTPSAYKNYINSLNNNVPEVYSYYAQVSLLSQDIDIDINPS